MFFAVNIIPISFSKTGVPLANLNFFVATRCAKIIHTRKVGTTSKSVFANGGNIFA